MYSLGNILKVKSMELIYWLYTVSNFSGVISLVQGCDTVLGYSDKNVNEFKVGFDEKKILVLLLNTMKCLNMTGLMDYHWGV